MAAIGDFNSGKIIPKNSRKIPHPSIIAASSISYGIPLMNPDAIMVEIPILKADITIMIESGLSTRCSFRIKMKIGITTIWDGSKIPSMAMDITCFLYFHCILVKAYASMVEITTVSAIVSKV